MSDQSKKEILNRIAAVRTTRKAAIFVDMTENNKIYRPVLPDRVSCFKSELEAINGQCIICNNQTDLIEKLKILLSEKQLTKIFCRDKIIAPLSSQTKIDNTSDVDEFIQMKAGITSCEFLIARTGSVIVTSSGDSGRQMNVFPPIHIILASSSQLLDFPEDAINALQIKYKNNLPSAITTITGPSRTADIEKTLVLGAHGPKELIVFLSVM